MKEASLCFVGAGNMAGSLIGGLIDNGYPADQVTACDIDQRMPLSERIFRPKAAIGSAAALAL